MSNICLRVVAQKVIALFLFWYDISWDKYKDNYRKVIGAVWGIIIIAMRFLIPYCSVCWTSSFNLRKCSCVRHHRVSENKNHEPLQNSGSFSLSYEKPVTWGHLYGILGVFFCHCV